MPWAHDESLSLQGDLEIRQLALNETLDYETKQKLNQPLDFEQVSLP